MKKLAICLYLGLFASTASAATLTCKNPVEYLHNGSWERTCQYEGSSLQEAYQVYRIVNPTHFQRAPQALPNENVRLTLKPTTQQFLSNKAARIRITWHNDHQVSVQETGNVRTKATFSREGNVVHIKASGIKP